MEPVRVLIVDDEPLARERIRTLLAEQPGIHLIGEAKEGREAVALIQALQPDLVFLDVQMPELNGFGVIDAVGASQMPAVVFVTAYDQHALRAFEVHALDYLLKPFDIDRFERSLAHALSVIQSTHRDDVSRKLENLLGEVQHPSKWLDRIMIKTRARIYFVRLEDVAWIEAAGNYLRLHTGDKTHLLRQTMSRLAEQLNPEHFIRIHRSTIVNVDRVEEIVPHFNGEYHVLLTDGTQLTMSRGYRDLLDRFAG